MNKQKRLRIEGLIAHYLRHARILRKNCEFDLATKAESQVTELRSRLNQGSK